jgi:hypothetical protein
MSRDITEIIDSDCEWDFGHKDWVIVNTLSDQEKVGLDSVADIRTYQGVQVAFYHDARDSFIEERSKDFYGYMQKTDNYYP